MNTSRKVLTKLLKSFFLDTFTLDEMLILMKKVDAGELQGVFVDALQSSIETSKIQKAYDIIKS